MQISHLNKKKSSESKNKHFETVNPTKFKVELRVISRDLVWYKSATALRLSDLVRGYVFNDIWAGVIKAALYK